MLSKLKTQISSPILIVGLGKSGTSALRLLTAMGFTDSEIYLYDDKTTSANGKLVYNSFTEITETLKPMTLVVSPGFPLSHPQIEKFKLSGCKITSEINLAYLALKEISFESEILGITGSLGKSTTTSLIGFGGKLIDPNIFVGGNLGTPFCDYAYDVIYNQKPQAKWLILELSSYQLENCSELQLDYSIITFLSANHLERYSSLNQYYETKWSIVKKTKHSVVLNAHGGDIESFSALKKLDKIVWANAHLINYKKYNLEDSRLIGAHNLDNLAMGVCFALTAGWPEETIYEMKSFSGLEHRLEFVAVKNEISFINDSKATALDSVEMAVAACLERKNLNTLHLLLGGKDKKLPWENLRSKLVHPRIRVYFFGESGSLISQSLNLSALNPNKNSSVAGQTSDLIFPTLKKCLSEITPLLAKDDLVLLSPGGTSHDEFKNFEERGRFFKSWVEHL